MNLATAALAAHVDRHERITLWRQQLHEVQQAAEAFGVTFSPGTTEEPVPALPDELLDVLGMTLACARHDACNPGHQEPVRETVAALRASAIEGVHRKWAADTLAALAAFPIRIDVPADLECRLRALKPDVDSAYAPALDTALDRAHHVATWVVRHRTRAKRLAALVPEDDTGRTVALIAHAQGCTRCGDELLTQADYPDTSIDASRLCAAAPAKWLQLTGRSVDIAAAAHARRTA